MIDNIGLMPYRRRIVSVSEYCLYSVHVYCAVCKELLIDDLVLVGRPINVQKCEKPTTEQIMEVQKQYIEELYRSVFTLPFYFLLVSVECISDSA